MHMQELLGGKKQQVFMRLECSKTFAVALAREGGLRRWLPAAPSTANRECFSISDLRLKFLMLV
jgi:hypothetical protein